MEEIPGDPISVALKALEPAFDHAIRIYKESHEAHHAAGISDFADENFNETLGRLVDGKFDQAWWQRLLNAIERPYVSPDALKRPSLQEWLGNELVQKDLKAEARDRLLLVPTRNAERSARLADAYSAVTGEKRQLANGPIELTVGILLAGFIASVPRALKGLAGLVQSAAAASESGLARLEAKTDQIGAQIDTVLAASNSTEPFSSELHDQVVRQRLASILKCRSFNTGGALEAIKLLSHDTQKGDLRFVKHETRHLVSYWLLRMYSVSKETTQQAKEILRALRAESPSTDLRVPEALILEHEGDVEGAIRILSGIDSEDGHTAYFGILRRRKTNAVAEAWYRSISAGKDLRAFTGIGWFNVAGCLAEEGHWQEAAELVRSLESEWKDWPDLAFLDGVLHCALLLPIELRPHVLRMDIFHPAIRPQRGTGVPESRRRAEASFKVAERLLGDLGVLALGRVEAVGDWRLWMALTDPDAKIVASAQERIRDEMKNGKRAIGLLPFVEGFGLKVDLEPLREYLLLRSKIGALDPAEVAAELLLAQIELEPRQFAEFLEKEGDRLSAVISRSSIVGKTIEAFAEVGQATKARELLAKYKSVFDKHDAERLAAIIDIRSGVDPRAQFEQLYEETKSLLDLRNLVRHLVESEDWARLRPFAEKLFEVERTPENAARLVHCLKSLPAAGARAVVDFFSREADVAEWSPRFAADFAWSLFETGRIREARLLVNRLISERRDSNDTQLDINLAIQSGEWERLSAIVDREWTVKDSLDAATALRLGVIAAEADSSTERAIVLATLATTKASDDPRILVGAYSLAVQLGMENAVDPGWVSKAAALSQSDGPVKQVDLRTLIDEFAPAHRKKTDEINKMLIRGEIPLHFAASVFNVQLSRMILDQSSRNERLADGRHRLLLPTFSAARRITAIPVSSPIGMDLTTLLALHWLGILREAIGSFHKILLGPSTMIELLNERRSVRFHQPSRVLNAERVRSLIDQGLLRPIGLLATPPEWLLKEVGPELAQMLQIAKTEGRTVVRGGPLYKLGAYMQEEADLREFSDCIVSAESFVKAIHEAGYLSSREFEHGIGRLHAFAHKRVPIPPHALRESYLLDDLALTHIQHAGILEAVVRSKAELFIHPSTRDDINSLIAAGTEGDRLARELDQIRLILRDLIAVGRIEFLGIGLSREDKMGASLTELLKEVGGSSGICVDDRFVNKFAQMTDQAGVSRPIFCTLDVLSQLEAVGTVSATRRKELEHRLRAGGFAFVGIDSDELVRLLRATKSQADGAVVESAELRVLREYLARLKAVELVQAPGEFPFLEQLQLNSISAITSIWADESIAVERSRALSSWIWNHVAPNPLDWVPSLSLLENKGQSQVALASHLRLVVLPSLKVSRERAIAYTSWVASDILNRIVQLDEESLKKLVALCERHVLSQIP